MFEQGDRVVVSNGDICTILECRGQGYGTDHDVYFVQWEDGSASLIDEMDIDGLYQ